MILMRFVKIRVKKKDFYIHSDMAVKYGIVDEVL